MTISDITFSPAPEGLVETGVIGFVSCTVEDALKLDGITLRRTEEGRAVLGFPARRDAVGRQHFFVQPLDDRTRRDLERQVFRALGLEQESVQ